MVDKLKKEEIEENPGPEFIDGIDEEYEESRKKRKRIRRILAVVMIIILGVYLLRFY